MIDQCGVRTGSYRIAYDYSIIGGRFHLSTQNYPFISRIVNAFSGGISTFNCKVYFVRKADTSEITWGMSLQVRDPVHMLATRVQIRGAYRIQIDNAKKFLIKMVGNNIASFTKEELPRYFDAQFDSVIKSAIAQYIRDSKREILGICSELDALSSAIALTLEAELEQYGIRIVNFSISGMDISEDDPNRAMLEKAMPRRAL